MGQVIRLEAAQKIGRELARRPEYANLKKPRKCDVILIASQLLAEADRKRDARLLRGCEELRESAQERDRNYAELREELEEAFRDERERIGTLEECRDEKKCARCWKEDAAVKVTATDLQGVLLDGPAKICRRCAADAGFEVGK